MRRLPQARSVKSLYTRSLAFPWIQNRQGCGERGEPHQWCGEHLPTALGTGKQAANRIKTILNDPALLDDSTYCVATHQGALIVCQVSAGILTQYTHITPCAACPRGPRCWCRLR